MYKHFVIVLFIVLGFNSFAQVNNLDSLEYNAIQDTLNMIFGISSSDDTISINKNTAITVDSTYTNDSIKKAIDKERIAIAYQNFLKSYSDTIKMYEDSDTLHFLIQKTNYFLASDSLFVPDSVFYAFKKLQLYIENRDISSVLKFLNKKVDNHEFPIKADDYYSINLNDSLKNDIRFILDYLAKDSLNMTFRNTQNEKEFFYSELGVSDSLHIKLYDQRGEYVILWIKKTSDNIFDLYLEDGAYLEKAKQSAAIQRKLKTKNTEMSLREIKQVNLVLPLWTYTGSVNMHFSQSYLSDWAAGGENSLSALSIFRYSVDLVYGKKIWDNDIEYKLGYLQAGDGPLQKNDDKFEFNSKYGHAAFKNWYYSFLLNFKTQFLVGYDYPKDTDPVPISGFMSPASLVFSLGLDYKPNKNLTLLISPLTSKVTIFTDTVSYDQTRFGIQDNKKSMQEIGAYIKLISKINLRRDISIENKLNLFTNYVDNPQNVDIDWEVYLNFELNEYFKFTFNSHLIYDDNIDIPVYRKVEGVKTKVGVTKKLQWKEVFSIGFTYKIFH
ncbi:MAG: hypothetical protein A2W99_12345 [Bacteroidetes bacterium GWF2_33_16]|nr:MAG: hypothetical protein A2X00_01930 [Bacteroidetes bacterium GWE2_32_14]OFY06483.1 MAG: hypothetical protein A2W99_12345 [Bacteroidetes bacterium GWF2_33_16]